MAVEDWGQCSDKWLIDYDRVLKEWDLWASEQCGNPTGVYSTHRTFAQAHAAYLDAVTCKKKSPFITYTRERCTRSKGHGGACLFPSLVEGRMPLRVNPK